MNRLSMESLGLLIVAVCSALFPIGVAQQLRNQVYLCKGREQPTFIYLCYHGEWKANPAEGQQAKVTICGWDAALKKDQVISEDYGFYLCVSNQGMIAFVQIAEENKGGPNPKTILRIIDTSGTCVATVHTEQTVRDLDWSPDGKQIVFLTGGESDQPERYPGAETWVYDVEKREQDKILDGGHDVEWAEFDNRIYIYEKGMDPQCTVMIRLQLKWNQVTIVESGSAPMVSTITFRGSILRVWMYTCE